MDLQKMNVCQILNPNESHSHSKLRKNALALTFKVAHQARAYPGFRSIKRLGIFLLSPQSIAGLPLALNLPVPIYIPGWRETFWESGVLPKNTTQCPRPGLDLRLLEQTSLTMRPPRLPLVWLTETENVQFRPGGFSYAIQEKFTAWRVNSTLNFNHRFTICAISVFRMIFIVELLIRK